MATALSVTYRVASGASVNAGRFAGGRFAGEWTIGGAAMAGEFEGVAPGPISVPDTRIYLQGQSNAMGVAASSALNTAPLSADPALYSQYLIDFERVWIFNAAGNAYEKLRYGVNQQANTSSQIGTEFGIAMRWMRETTGGNLYIDKQTASGQEIAFFQSGQSFFTTSQTRRTAANAWLAARSITVAPAGWVWVQGESDYLESQATYQSALTTLVNSRISVGLQGAGEKRVIAQMIPGTRLYGAGVKDAKDAYAAANPTTTSIITMANYFNADNLHLNARGQLQLGYDAAAILFSLSYKAA